MRWIFSEPYHCQCQCQFVNLWNIINEEFLLELIRLLPWLKCNSKSPFFSSLSFVYVEKQIKHLRIDFRYYFTMSGNVRESNNAFLWIIVCCVLYGRCLYVTWQSTLWNPQYTNRARSAAMPCSRHWIIDRVQNERRNIKRTQKPSDPKRFMCNRNDSYLIIISVFIKYFYTWSGCVPIYMHQFWISDIFGSLGFREFPFSLSWKHGCELWFFFFGYLFVSIFLAHTHTRLIFISNSTSKNRKNYMMKIGLVGGMH